MRVRTKPMKKLMSFVLLLAMIGTMMWPSNSYAADTDEEPAVTDSGAAKETKELEMPYDETGEPSEDPKETLEDSKISGQTEQKTEQETGQKTESTTEESSGSKSDSKFETTAPVIEKVELAQNQTTVKRDAQISVSVFAYDDSEIADIRVGMVLDIDESHTSSQRYLMEYPEKWSKVEGTNEYVGTYQLDGQTTGRLAITSVEVVDEHGNMARYTDLGGKGSRKFWVDIEPAAEDEAASVESFEFPDNGKSLEKIDDLKKEISLKLTKPIESTYVWLRFEKEGGGYYYETRLRAVNSSAKNDVFDNSKGIDKDNNLASGKYILKDIYIKQGHFETKVSLMMENLENYGFTLTTDSKDTGKDIEYKITSVELDKKGQKVQKGDTVNITVSVATDDGVKLPERGNVLFQAAAPNINDSSRWVSLTLNTEDHKYHGSFVVGDMYPCEWYINSIYIGNKDDNSYVKELDYPYYILVYNGDSFVNPELDLNIYFFALDENGKFVPVEHLKKENVQRRQTLKEIGVTFPEKNAKYQGLTQIGWTDRLGREVADSMAVVDKNYIEIYAKYDKGVFQAGFDYPNSEGEWTYASHLVTYEYGQTYGDLKENKLTFIPEDITKDYTLTNWEYGYLDHKESDLITVTGNTNLRFNPKFSGVTALYISKYYYDEKGYDHGTGRYAGEFLMVKEGTKTSDMEGILKALEMPKMYPGLRFKEWEIFAPNMGTEVVQNGASILMRASYENCLVSYIINAYVIAEEEGTVFCQVAEKGEKVSALTEFEGFGEITWDEAPDQEFVVNSDMKFWGRADSVSTDPSKPSKPSGSTSGSGNNTNSDTNAAPDSRLPQDVVDSAVKDVNEAEAGETVKISMNSKTVVPKEVLEAAKGKDVSVVLEMEGYSWTINGKDIKATNLQDIDLRVIKNTDNIPSSTVQTLAGDNPCMQITLAHEGNFGFKASLNIGVGSEYTGKYGNLYYHDSAGKMVFMNAGKIGADGNVSLDFSHASDYLLVMSDQAMSQENVPGSLNPTGTSINQNGNGNINIPTTNTGSNVNNANDTGNDSKADDAGNSSKIRRSAKTGDYDTVYLWLLLCAAAMGVMAYTSRKKRI